MQSPVKKQYITQVFGANPTAYAKFGLKGHNGIDYRAFLPNGDRCYEPGKSEVFAPHDGQVLENALDPEGYGNYIKIEDETQGSVLAHLASKSPHAVGTKVKKGQLIGYQGSTGNSTGIHLHWGWYPKPRNRQNGYNGYENQAGKYTDYQEGETMPDTIPVEKAVFEELVAKATKYDEINKNGYVTKADHDAEVGRKNDEIGKLKTDLTGEQTAHQTTKEELAKTKQLLTDCQNKPITTPAEPKERGRLNGYQKTYVKDGITITDNYAIDG